MCGRAAAQIVAPSRRFSPGVMAITVRVDFALTGE